MECLFCKKITSNPKFCSRNCAASFNNRVVPKRLKKVRLCDRCGDDISHRHNRAKRCVTCANKHDDLTLQQLTYKTGHRSNAFGHIRGRARTVTKNAGLVVCKVCGYSLHVEVCHIRKIASFPADTLISEINALENLIVLCPNHHWEFDNGHLQQ